MTGTQITKISITAAPTTDPQDAPPTVHQLKVTLERTTPKVWRRLLVPSTATLGDVSEVLLAAFDWSGEHLHQFESADVRYGPEDPFDDLDPEDGLRDEEDVSLHEVAPGTGDRLEYTYDLGDDWRHRIEVEDVYPADPRGVYPECRDGHGLAPEEDTGAVRPGAFTEPARLELNLDLAELDLDLGQSELDRVGRSAALPFDAAFSGLFPALIDLAEAPCENCGEVHEGRQMPMLRPYRPVPEGILEQLATGSALVGQALALVSWVGDGRAVTVDGVLLPADALQAATELGLTGGVPARRKLRDARKLPQLQAVWSATVHAGLLDLHGNQVSPGEAGRVWLDTGSPQDRLDSWAQLVSGYLRARDEADTAAYEPITDDQVTAVSAQLFYTLADQPVPAAMPALVLATSISDDDGPSVLTEPGLFARLPSLFVAAAEDWIHAGVLELVTDSHPSVQALGVESVSALIADSLESVLDLPAPLERLLDPVLKGVRTSPAVELTPLGQYGLQRLLVAHGYDIPTLGNMADVPPELLLDLLMSYPADAVEDEARIWLEARGDQWRSALLAVAESARTPDESLGPVRRILFTAFLIGAGERVAPVLEELASDPWLGAIAANARYELDLGPGPTPGQQLWLAVDELSGVLEEPDVQLQAFLESDIADLLEMPGAMAVAVRVDHPHTREVLRLVAELSDDPELSGRLRRALGGKSSTKQSGGTSGRGRSAGGKSKKR